MVFISYHAFSAVAGISFPINNSKVICLNSVNAKCEELIEIIKGEDKASNKENIKSDSMQYVIL
jgi:hypothetical protein